MGEELHSIDNFISRTVIKNNNKNRQPLVGSKSKYFSQSPMARTGTESNNYGSSNSNTRKRGMTLADMLSGMNNTKSRTFIYRNSYLHDRD